MTRVSYNPNPSLIPLISGANGFKGLGDALVSLGDDKIKSAKEAAAKTELKAKESALAQATVAKNMALNPEAVKAVQSSYGIEEGSALASPSAPTVANASLGLVDLGKADKPLKPTYDNYKTVGKNLVDVTTGKVVYSAPNDGTTTAYNDKFVEFFTDDGGNRLGVKGNGQKVNLGKAKEYNVANEDKRIPDGMMATDGLSGDAIMYLRDNGLVRSINGKYYTTKEARARAMENSVGNIDIEVE